MSNCLFQGVWNVSLLLAPGSPASAPSVPLLFTWCVCGIRTVSLSIVRISQLWREKGEIIPLAATVHRDFRGYNEGQTACLSSSVYQLQDAPGMVCIYSQFMVSKLWSCGNNTVGYTLTPTDSAGELYSTLWCPLLQLIEAITDSDLCYSVLFKNTLSLVDEESTG